MLKRSPRIPSLDGRTTERGDRKQKARQAP